MWVLKQTTQTKESGVGDQKFSVFSDRHALGHSDYIEFLILS